MLAAARALESAGTSDAAVMASEMAALTVSDPGRRYPPYARLLLETLTGPGLPLESIPYLAVKFLDVSNPLSHDNGLVALIPANPLIGATAPN